MIRLLLLSFLATGLHAATPRDALPLDAPEWPLNYRLHLEGPAGVTLSDELTITLEAGEGTLISKCSPAGKWSPDAKALFIRGGRPVCDIGWLGAMAGGPMVNDGKPHTVVLSVSGGTARLWLDGKVIAENATFTTPGTIHQLEPRLETE